MESYDCPECGQQISVLADSDYGYCSRCGRTYRIDRDAEVSGGEWTDRTKLHPVSLVIYRVCSYCGKFLGTKDAAGMTGGISDGCCDECFARVLADPEYPGTPPDKRRPVGGDPNWAHRDGLD